MQRADLNALTDRVLERVRTGTLDTADGIWREPRAAFVSPERLAADRAMLLRTPQVIGWAGEVARPGDFTTKDVMGIPVLVARDAHGDVRAFVNACAHRGAQVADGSGSAHRFTCPYHGWTYGPDGCLTGAPARRMFDGADLDSRGLIPLPVSLRAGLICVGLQPGVDTRSCLDGVENDLAGFDFAHYEHVETRRFDLAANWKLAVDVNFEGYHFPFLHKQTVDPTVSNNSVYDTFGRHARWAFPFRSIERLRDLPRESWPADFEGSLVWFLFPNAVLIELPGAPQLFRVYPGTTPGTCTVFLSQGSPVPVVTDEQRAAHAGFLEGITSLLTLEDFPAAEACQRGLAAGLDHALFGRNEPMLHHLAHAWAAALTPS